MNVIVLVKKQTYPTHCLWLSKFLQFRDQCDVIMIIPPPPPQQQPSQRASLSQLLSFSIIILAHFLLVELCQFNGFCEWSKHFIGRVVNNFSTQHRVVLALSGTTFFCSLKLSKSKPWMVAWAHIFTICFAEELLFEHFTKYTPKI